MLATLATSPATLSPATPVSQEIFPPGRPTPEFLRLVPHEHARTHLVLSAGLSDGTERLLVSDRTPGFVIFNIASLLRRPVEARVTPADTLASLIDDAFAANPTQPGTGARDLGAEIMLESSGSIDELVRESLRTSDADLLNIQNKSSSIRLMDQILFDAVHRGVSDVHIQPLSGRTLVRYRKDGVLATWRELPPHLANILVTRVKVMGRLDVAERRTAQDGRASVSIGGSAGAGAKSNSGRRIDLRISVLPSTYGERVVLRLLDPKNSPHVQSFSSLGMPANIERDYLQRVARSSGIVLSTGPTGSGKTTTLYTTLAWISQSNTAIGTNATPLSVGHAKPHDRDRGCGLNIMTIEDPVEYDLSSAGLAISQTQLDAKKSLTFVTGLKHILRQDPDVIMVGEIRDEETAKIAVQASLTGHLVLSTLHTNDAPSAVARLIDLTIEPFLVASSLTAVLAQRLVRTTHKPCNGLGCEACFASGFSGRVGVFELFAIDEHTRTLIAQRSTTATLRTAARSKGYTTLREAGLELARTGQTTPLEIDRVLDGSETIA